MRRDSLELDQVKVTTLRAGLAEVVHVASGLVLGRVRREGKGRDAEWEVYTAGDEDHPVTTDDRRELAIESLLDPMWHHPGKATLDRPGHRGRRELTEAEFRRALPAEWAWWDKVDPLFPSEWCTCTTKRTITGNRCGDCGKPLETGRA